MGTRTAIRQSPIVAFFLLFVTGWVVLVGLGVAAGARAPEVGDWVGRHGVGGVVGLGVLLAFVLLLVVLLGEASEVGPAPEEWPPE